MVTLELKGLHRVTAKGRTYWYAWRGGPRLVGEPGSTAFLNSYNEAIASRKTQDDGRFRSLVRDYRASSDYSKLADSTRRNWGPWLDRIADHFGELSVAQFDRTEKIRPVIRRGALASRQIHARRTTGCRFSRGSAAYAVDPLGRLASNPCVGIKHIYSSSRADIIWTDADIAEAESRAARRRYRSRWTWPLCTGLRAGDLVRLSWSHVQEDAIVITTGKSKHRREAVIPLYQELRDLLARIPRRSPVVLTNSRGGHGRKTDWAMPSCGPRSWLGLTARISTFTICAGRQRPSSTSPACRSVRSPRSSGGRKTALRALSGATLVAALR